MRRNKVKNMSDCKTCGVNSPLENLPHSSSDTPLESLKIYIKTFGCQMNLRDSEVVCGLLEQAGCEVVDTPGKADVLIFNTCAVRDHAEARVWSEVGRYKGQSRSSRLRRGSGTVPNKLIGLVGCMAKNYGQDVFRRAPYVDFVVGPRDIAKVPGIVEEIIRNDGEVLDSSACGGLARTITGRPRLNNKAGTVPSLFQKRIWETDGESRPEEIYHTGFRQDAEHAYVVISEGCSNYCSYCVVPYARGPLRNRKYKDILREIEQALDQGVSKVTLLGQNVNAYEDGEVNFIKLIELVDKFKGLKDFTFVTSHPKDTSKDLFKAMAGARKLKKDLHMPLQSGSDRILKLMNRGYTFKNYLDLVEDYRRIVKGGTLTTDLILGFPGEIVEDFEATYKAVEQIRFNAAYIFKYSPRPHTKALEMEDDVPRSEKARRHSEILELQRGISRLGR